MDFVCNIDLREPTITALVINDSYSIVPGVDFTKQLVPLLTDKT
jgi:hypothetical protein